MKAYLSDPNGTPLDIGDKVVSKYYGEHCEKVICEIVDIQSTTLTLHTVYPPFVKEETHTARVTDCILFERGR